MLELLDLVWNVIKTIIWFWVIYKVLSIIYFWLTADEVDKKKIELQWTKSKNLASFVKNVNELVENKTV